MVKLEFHPDFDLMALDTIYSMGTFVPLDVEDKHGAFMITQMDYDLRKLHSEKEPCDWHMGSLRV